MAVADLYLIKIFKERKHKKPKYINEICMAEYPTNDEIGQAIKDYKGDMAQVEQFYRLLPFE